MVEAIRITEKAIGKVTYERTPKECSGLAFRRSIFFTRDLPAGHRICPDDLQVVRPGAGLAPRHWDHLLNRSLSRSVTRGTPAAWELID
jgi:sialic acid synthase SpsE